MDTKFIAVDGKLFADNGLEEKALLIAEFGGANNAVMTARMLNSTLDNAVTFDRDQMRTEGMKEIRQARTRGHGGRPQRSS